MADEPIDFTITATCRPEILAKTLLTFRDGLKGVDLGQSKLFLNIDPIPNPAEVAKVNRIAQLTFGQVWTHIPIPGTDPASFPAAVKWCWSRPTSEFFFHLEDDWELLKPVEIGELIEILRNDPGLSAVSLRAYTGINDDRICLSPGLFRTDHARIMADRLSTKVNPEKQLRPVTTENPEGGKQEGFRGTQYPKENGVGSELVHDLGRVWLHESGWRKGGSTDQFTCWEPINEVGTK